jgi:cytochrome c553
MMKAYDTFENAARENALKVILWSQAKSGDFLANTIMKMKTQILVKTTVATAFFAGVICSPVIADDGAQLWKMNCAQCHGEDGKGSTMIGRRWGIKDLTEPKVQASFTDADATKIIKEGVTDNGHKMKPFQDKLTDDQIKTLVAHVRSFKPAK